MVGFYNDFCILRLPWNEFITQGDASAPAPWGTSGPAKGAAAPAPAAGPVEEDEIPEVCRDAIARNPQYFEKRHYTSTRVAWYCIRCDKRLDEWQINNQRSYGQ